MKNLNFVTRLIIFAVAAAAAFLLMLTAGNKETAAEEHIIESPQETKEMAVVPELVETGDQTDYCLDCHQDKEALISTAKMEEEVESENEGAG